MMPLSAMSLSSSSDSALGRNRPAGDLLHFDFERLGVVQPAAGGVGLAQFGDGGQGFVATAESVERVGLPVLAAIGASRRRARPPG